MNELRQKNRSWAEGISAKGMKDDERRDQSSKGVRSLRIFEHLDFGGSIIFFCPLHLSWPFRFCFPVIPATPDAPPELRLGMRLLQHRRRRALNALKRGQAAQCCQRAGAGRTGHGGHDWGCFIYPNHKNGDND